MDVIFTRSTVLGKEFRKRKRMGSGARSLEKLGIISFSNWLQILCAKAETCVIYQLCFTSGRL